MNIVVVGTGYVGLSNAIVLAQNHDVVAVDIDPHKVTLINRRDTPIADPEIEHYLKYMPLSLTATTDAAKAYANADLIVVATPTDFDEATQYFDTSSVEEVIDQAFAINPVTTFVVKSTVPIGFTTRMRKEHDGASIIFAPEFLREGRALHDNLHPSRIVVGDRTERGRLVADLLLEGAVDKDVPVLLTDPTEAEAIKLFANTYLAMRVAYFNEIDTFAAIERLSAAQIIEGVGMDPRIGSHYNNPSFGYGGYCLPKDTKQLLANVRSMPQNLLAAIVEANATRKDFIVADILDRDPAVVGMYRLTMKTGSDNFRASAVQGIMERLKGGKVEIIVHEPTLDQGAFFGYEVVRDLDEFKARADVIVANRNSEALADVAHKIYTRDISGCD